MTAALLSLPVLYQMPRTRAGCADLPRPCPCTQCRYNLHADFPSPGDSCVLDVVEDSDPSYARIAKATGLSRARGEQVLKDVLSRPTVRKALADYADLIGSGQLSALASIMSDVGTTAQSEAITGRHPYELASHRLQLTSSETDERTACDRAYALYASGGPCLGKDVACILSSGHAGECVVGQAVKNKRGRRRSK